MEIEAEKARVAKAERRREEGEKKEET